MSRSALVYTALAAIAIAAAATFFMRQPAQPLPASPNDMSAIEDLRSGSMGKLVFHSPPREVSETPFNLPDGAGTATLADYRGKYVLVNFWATWCAPCRKEMPTLSALQTALGSDRFQVVTIATGNNRPTDVKRFFHKIDVANLPRSQDAKSSLARDIGIFGLPTTLILNPEGREIARLMGDADWNSDSARAIISALLALS